MCGIFSLDTCWNDFIGHFWWLQYWHFFFYGIIAIFCIWLLSKAKEIAGVPGELTVVSAASILFGIWLDRYKLQKKPVPKVVPTIPKPKHHTIFDSLPPKSLGGM